jgi:hypothetical protein
VARFRNSFINGEDQGPMKVMTVMLYGYIGSCIQIDSESFWIHPQRRRGNTCISSDTELFGDVANGCVWRPGILRGFLSGF